MKLLIIMMTVVGLTVFDMPLLAQENIVIHGPDTTEARDNLTNQKPGTVITTGSDFMLSQKEKMKRPVIKIYTCKVHTDIITDKPGRCFLCGALLYRSLNEKNRSAVTRKYKCTIHQDVTGKKAGKCTICSRVLKSEQQSSSRHPHKSLACSNPGKSGKCKSCNTNLMRSSKEKMKMEVMNNCCCHSEQPAN